MNEISDLRKCPYCAELVQKDAQICKHCGKNINPTMMLGKQLTGLGGSLTLACGLLFVIAIIAFCLFALLSGIGSS